MQPDLSPKIERQIEKAGLPRTGAVPFVPKIRNNRRGEREIEKAEVEHGPKQGKKGYVDVQGNIWIKDRAHAGLPDHWDVQIDGGKRYVKVDLQGNLIDDQQNAVASSGDDE
ncbi:MAG: hypothetical protein HYS13_21805 [Planctomycetia bacterium]|nr:hypothetical protein [Planctomycetia bacterium]